MLTAYFPGWAAYLNTTPMNLTPATDGLINVNLPNAVRGELTVALGTTVPRTLGWVLSWLNLFLLGVITVYRTRHSRDHYDVLDLLPRAEALLLGGVLVGFAVVLALFVVPFAPVAVQAQAYRSLAGSASIDNHSDAGLEVQAYRLDTTQYRPGDSVNLTLYWRTLRFLDVNYRVRVSLLDLTTGDYRLPTTPRTPGGYPTARWLPRLFVTDPYRIALPADFPPGSYSPAVEVCAGASAGCDAAESRLTFFEQDGSTYGQVLVLPIILIVS
ncbi:MAG: hypothetical protein U0521_08310 [Anaerolineae bacterium]